jgi:hypothetical protein
MVQEFLQGHTNQRLQLQWIPNARIQAFVLRQVTMAVPLFWQKFCPMYNGKNNWLLYYNTRKWHHYFVWKSALENGTELGGQLLNLVSASPVPLVLTATVAHEVHHKSQGPSQAIQLIDLQGWTMQACLDLSTWQRSRSCGRFYFSSHCGTRSCGLLLPFRCKPLTHFLRSNLLGSACAINLTKSWYWHESESLFHISEEENSQDVCKIKIVSLWWLFFYQSTINLEILSITLWCFSTLMFFI